MYHLLKVEHFTSRNYRTRIFNIRSSQICDLLNIRCSKILTFHQHHSCLPIRLMYLNDFPTACGNGPWYKKDVYTVAFYFKFPVKLLWTLNIFQNLPIQQDSFFVSVTAAFTNYFWSFIVKTSPHIVFSDRLFQSIESSLLMRNYLIFLHISSSSIKLLLTGRLVPPSPVLRNSIRTRYLKILISFPPVKFSQ